jgi:hypothetical protein
MEWEMRFYLFVEAKGKQNYPITGVEAYRLVRC